MAEERKLLWKYNSEFSYRCLIFYRCPASSAPIALQTWCQICWHYQVSLVQRTHTLSQLSLTSSYSEEENWIHRWSCMQGNQYRPTTKCCTRLVPSRKIEPTVLLWQSLLVYSGRCRLGSLCSEITIDGYTAEDETKTDYRRNGSLSCIAYVPRTKWTT